MYCFKEFFENFKQCVLVILHPLMPPTFSSTPPPNLVSLSSLFYWPLLPPPPHTHWICLVLTIHSCTPYSNMVSLPGTTLFKKTELFFPWSHQLSIALLQLGVGACELLPNQCWMLIGLFLSSSFVGKQSCCKFVSAVFLSCPEDAVLSWSSMTSSTCNPSTPSSTMVPEPCGRGMV